MTVRDTAPAKDDHLSLGDTLQKRTALADSATRRIPGRFSVGRGLCSLAFLASATGSGAVLLNWSQPNLLDSPSANCVRQGEGTHCILAPYWPTERGRGTTLGRSQKIRKVRLYPGQLPYTQHHDGSAKKGAGQWGIPRGARLAILLNEGCGQSPAEWERSRVLARTVSFDWPEEMLGQGEVQTRYHRSPWQTHRFTLGFEVPLSRLEFWAESQPCVAGISHNVDLSLAEGSSAAAAPEREGGGAGGNQRQNLTSADPLLGNQTHLAAISALNTDNLFFGPGDSISRDVIVAIIDTGVDLQHPDLKDHLWRNTGEADGIVNTDDDRNGYVDDVYGFNFQDRKGDPAHLTANDHGTHVAGLAAAVASNGIGVSGVIGHRVRILPLNVFGSRWQPDTISIDEAIRYAADQGANVINISIGAIGHSDTTASAIAYAIQRGAIVVAAAGNNGKNLNDEFYFPASYAPSLAGLVSVAASDAKLGTLCDFSNYGNGLIKITAPGCDQSASKQGLLSTRAGAQYGFKKGTSMAAPQVTGAVALAFGWIRDKTGTPPSPAVVERVLLESTENSEKLAPFAEPGRFLSTRKLAERIVQLFPQKTDSSR